MTYSTQLSSAFAAAISKIGTPIKIEYFNQVTDLVYDEPNDSESLILSGTIWTSGAVLPLKTIDGSEDSVLLKQGKLQNKDKKLYVNGSTNFTSISDVCKIQLGSPTGEIYSTIPLGGKAPEISGEKIYKKQYIRYLGTTGSF